MFIYIKNLFHTDQIFIKLLTIYFIHLNQIEQKTANNKKKNNNIC